MTYQATAQDFISMADHVPHGEHVMFTHHAWQIVRAYIADLEAKANTPGIIRFLEDEQARQSTPVQPES